MLLALYEEQIEEELRAGLLSCSCSGQLRPWSHARVRLIRERGATVVKVRPRRAICARCRRTHVLLSARYLPRRRDSAETIGDALLRAAGGHGHRLIAEALDRPASTVRNWLRRARARAVWLREQAIRTAHDLDGGLPPAIPRTSPLAEAIDALGVAARAATHPLGLAQVPPWAIIASVSSGQLLAVLPDG